VSVLLFPATTKRAGEAKDRECVSSLDGLNEACPARSACRCRRPTARLLVVGKSVAGRDNLSESSARTATLDAPIPECEHLQTIRRKLGKLARTDLPIVLVGEPGTGRRTLAEQVAAIREKRIGVLRHLVAGGAGLGDLPPMRAKAMPLVVEHIHSLNRADQLRLGAWIKNGKAILSGTMTANDEAPLAPELAAALSYPSTAIEVPSLRERNDDPVQWAEYFLANVKPQLRFDQSALAVIRQAPWSGNLLELRTTVERAAAVAEGPLLRAAQIVSPDPEANELVPLSVAVAEFKLRHILKTLERCGGNRTRAARALGVDPRTIFRVLEQHADG
jgi:transcriptional regulator of acetoin/glycerol metabolism